MTPIRTIRSKRTRLAALLGGILAVTAASNASAAPAIDVVEAPTGYFLPAGTSFSTDPYYRDATEDWGWTHGAIVTPFTTATLNIGAYDVDFSQGEVDNIYVWDTTLADWVLLGALTGVNNDYSYTTFDLGPNFFDEIAGGLQVRVDINATNSGIWLLTLSKSVLSVDQGVLPPPTPGGAVPEPATWAMMLMGFGAIGSAIRRSRKRKSILAQELA